MRRRIYQQFTRSQITDQLSFSPSSVNPTQFNQNVQSSLCVRRLRCRPGLCASRRSRCGTRRRGASSRGAHTRHSSWRPLGALPCGAPSRRCEGRASCHRQARGGCARCETGCASGASASCCSCRCGASLRRNSSCTPSPSRSRSQYPPSCPVTTPAPARSQAIKVHAQSKKAISHFSPCLVTYLSSDTAIKL